ncbi:discoidin domain-containing protein [Flavobacterium sp.]|jgi:hypothetical protein|uniref:discoidin domain-containing protein n=1 Tax=Flavobacterium sp. TaxID=239 RepID=UPI0037C046F8
MLNSTFLKTVKNLSFLFLFTTCGLSASTTLINENYFIDASVTHPEIINNKLKLIDYKEYHLFSHGRAGELFLDGKWCNAKQIVAFLRPRIHNSQFTIHNLNIYGCEFAQGLKGLSAVSYIESKLNVHVAASINVTGKDGDWKLELGNSSATINFDNYPFNLQCTGTVGGTGLNDDFDGDGICNSSDIDDDNDGILDAVEAPSCYSTQADVAGISSVTSQLSSNSYPTRTNWYDNNSSTLSDFVLNVPAINKEIYNITPAISPLAINAISFEMGYYSMLTAYSTAKLQGFDGSVWVDLSTAQLATVKEETQTFINTLHPTTAYQKFRILGVSGTINWAYCKEIHLIPNAVSYGSAYPKATCLVDTDSDGITNDKDLDSDGDGCPDAKEGGVIGVLLSGSIKNGLPITTTPNVPSAIAKGPYGPNGLANSIETDGTVLATTLYLPNYTYVSSKALNTCADTDGDGIGDLVDIDDDNDGVLDAIEAPYCYYTQEEVVGISLVTSQIAPTDLPPRINWYDNNSTTYSDFYANASIVYKELYNITPSISPLAISAVSFDMLTQAMLTAGSTAILQGFDGTTWVDLSSPQTATVTSGTQIFTNTLQPTTRFQQFRIYGVSGRCWYGYCTEIHLIPSVPSYGSSSPKPICTIDTDGDGLTNDKDLDSDGDGCGDAKEASATTSTTPNYTFAGPYGVNGLSNVLETIVDNGITNYFSTYSANATSSFINTCKDTDGDGILDYIADIDDDNDGVLDSVEAPSCYYNATEIGIPTAVSSELVSGSGIMANLFDNNLTTNQSFIAQDIAGKTIYEVIPALPLAITALNLYNGSPIFVSTNKVKLQGWSGSAWIDLSTATTPTTPDAYSLVAFPNSINPTVPYLKYRLWGDITSTGNINTYVVNEITLIPTAYQPSKYPKSTCNVDLDGDGKTNDKDLDSDDDNCSDSKEAGATLSNIANYSFSGPYGTNGLANALETIVDNGIINYVLNYQYASSKTLNVCVDTDVDGIFDIVDIDDDNDGIIDSVEAPSCYYTLAEATTINLVTTELRNYSKAPGPIKNSYDNNSTTFFGFESTNIENKVLYNITPTFSPIAINAVSFDMGFHAILTVNSTAKLQGFDGLNWVDLSAPQTATVVYGTQIFTNTLQPTTKFQKFRIYGVTGISSHGYCYEIHLITNASINGFYFPKSTCTEDTDNDGLTNDKDLDSDADGCSDAREGNATTSITSNYTFVGPYGSNGFANVLETVVDNGMPNFISTYSPTATTNVLNACNDSDVDGIFDLADIDDDNDGILDAIEAPSCYYTAAESKVITSITTQLMPYSAITNSYDNNATTYSAFLPSLDWVDKELFNITLGNTLPLSSIELDLVNWALSSTSANTFKLQGFDGVNWTDLSPALYSTASTGTLVVSNSLQPNASYKNYRIVGISGTTNYGGVSEIRVNILANYFYQASSHPKTTCSVDTDGDGITNDKDLDSDGDTCSDAKEANATSSTTASYTFAGPYGTNGLANSLETAVDNGVLNYSPTYQYAISNTISGCTDTDGDGIWDVTDIDDDNDGIKDAVESPACYYTQAEISAISSVTSQLAASSYPNRAFWFDNNSTTYSDFNANVSVVDQEIYNITPTISPLLVNAVSFDMDTYSILTGVSTAKLQGFDGVSWVDLSAAQLATVSNGIQTFSNSLHPTTAYQKFRLLGVSGTSSWAYCKEIRLIPVASTYGSSAPKSNCLVDTDGDGITNDKDLDSDGDGCPDAKETRVSGTLLSGSIRNGLPNVTTSNVSSTIAQGPYGTNGLANSIETNDSSTANTTYSATYINATSIVLNACADTDGDGIGDLVDIDDDNDGVIDAVEAPTCYYDQGDVAGINAVTTELAASSYPIRTNWYDNNASTLSDFTPVAIANKELYNITPTFSPLAVSSISFDMTTYSILQGTATAKLQGYDGVSWVDLSTEQTATVTNGTQTFTNSLQPTNKFQKFRIYGVSGSCSYALCSEIHLTPASVSYGSFYPKATCTVDTDGDGITNDKDLDSDGDSCPDAKESGVSGTLLSGSIKNGVPNITTSNVSSTIAQGPYGENGLANSIEINDTSSSTTTYLSTYTNAGSKVLNACLDTDNDGIFDLVDIDDDNDGVIDAVEAPSCYYSVTESSAISKVTTEITTSLSITNSYDNDKTTYSYFIPNLDWVGKEIFNITPEKSLPFSGVDFYMVNWGLSNASANTFKLQGFDGGSWIDLSPATTSLASTGIFTASNTLQPNVSFQKYRLIGVAGTNYYGGISEIRMALPANYQASYFPKAICLTDTDGDGKTNDKDLDSDGDNCSDAKEASATASDTTNYTFASPYGANGLANSLETVVDNGIVNYIPTYQYASSNILNVCADTDSDGIFDLVDIDDDNDGILDSLESSCTIGLMQNKSDVLVSTSMTYNYNGSQTLHDLVDGVDGTTYVIYNPSGTYSNNTWLQFELPTAKKLTLIEIGHYPGQTLFATTSTYKIQGSIDNTTWTDIVANQTYTNTAPIYATNNSAKLDMLGNTTAYKYYRIQGISGSVGNGWAQELYFREQICVDLDTDLDGIPNRLDLDSDADGCSDAKEGNATTNITASFTFAGPYGINGFADTLETSVESGIANYVSDYSLIATNNLLNACTDTDGDGINDLVDIDDDNDGVLDVVEAPSCYYALNEVNGINSVTTEMPLSNKFPAAITSSYDNSYTTYSTFQEWQTVVNRAIYNITPTTSPLAISAISFDMGQYSILNGTSSTAKLQGFDGATWIDLSAPKSAIVNYGSEIFTNTLHPTTAYQQFRLFGVSGICNPAFCNEIHLIPAAVSYGTLAPKPTCSVDTDGDGITNDKDLDSDGDGCSDAREANATSNTATNYTFIGPYGTNGLANYLETAVDSGIINFNSTYQNAVTNTIKACLDTDGDGIFDVVDIDDDNDGVLDAVEAPSCYYTASENKAITSVTSQLEPYNIFVIGNSFDNNVSTYSAFAPDLYWVNRELFTITPTHILPFIGVEFDLINWALSNGASNTFKLQGFDGATWIDLSTEIYSTAASGTFTASNTLHPDLSYLKYRLIGVSGKTFNGGVKEIRMTLPANYQMSAYPKSNCLVDTDGDGITNDKDPDSDGDGCSDAKEAGATTNSSPNYAFPAPYGANGLANALETTLDSGIINYISTYNTVASSIFLNACKDTDNDGIGDLVDIDDDNDGVLDAVEAPSCYYAQNEVNGVSLVTTDIPSYDKNRQPIENCYDNFPTTFSTFSTTGVLGMELYNITPTFSPMAVNSISFDMDQYAMLTASSTAKLQGFDGVNWVDLSAPQTATVTYGTQSFINTLQPATKFQKFRIYGVSGSSNYAYCSQIRLVANAISYGSSYPKPTCSEDSDGDGITNEKDLDSDNDGCSDANEANATSSNATNYSFPAPYGTNGLANSLETTLDSGVVNYTSTYFNAINYNIYSCTDTDGDGITDLVDIDDDNDGVKDAIEAPSCYYSSTEITKPIAITTELTSVNIDGILANLIDNNLATTHSFDAQDIAGKVIYELTPASPAAISTLNLFSTTTIFTSTNKVKLQGWTGSVWIDLSLAVTPPAISIGTISFSNTLNPTFSYLKFRLIGDVSSIGNINSTYTNVISEITFTPTNYDASSHPKTTCSVDTDGDGITNDKDLDSDGDTCSDAKEANATSSTTASYTFAGPYGTNGLANSLETAVDNGVLNYSPTYQYAISNTISGCTDTDGDGIWDVTDIDDDNDGIKDAVESPACYYTQAEISAISSVTSQLAASSYPNRAFWFDNNSTTYSDFNANVSVVDQEIYNITPTISPLLVNAVSFDMDTYSILTGVSTAKLQGFDGVSWVDLSAAQLATVSNGIQTFSNSLHPTTAYQKFRLLGVSGTSSWAYCKEIRLIPVASTYGSSAPKSNCLVDTDGDGITNDKDLDSDGDGCPDAKETRVSGTLLSGSIRNGLPNVTTSNVSSTIAQGPYGTNGLANSIETNDSSTANTTYSATYINATSIVLNACADTDGDGIGDLVDIDDDNDGVIDAVEAPTCYYDQGDVAGINAVTTELAASSYPIRTNWYDNNASTLSDFTPVAIANKELYNITPTFSPLAVSSISFDMTTYSILQGTATAKLQGYDGVSWVDLSTEQTATVTNGTQTFTNSLQPTNKFQKFRIYGVSGSCSYALCSEIHLTPASVSYGSFYPKATCTVDTDGDGITNDKDLDSDGDSCPDAKESGVSGTLLSGSIKNGVPNITTSNVSSTIAQGPYGENGLANSIEINDTSSSTTTYLSTYTNASSKVLNACLDTDNDGIFDLVDIDDDNDGVIDAVEAPSCYYTAAEKDAVTLVTSQLTPFESYVIGNSYDNNVSTFSAFNLSLDWVGKELFNITPVDILPYNGVDLDLVNWPLSNGTANTFKLQGFDGLTWTDLSPALSSTGTTGTFTAYNTLKPTISYQKYRLIGVAGTSYYGGVNEVRMSLPASYQSSSYPKAICSVDTDGDGITNDKDLDSDGDGCSDGREAGATLSNVTNYVIPGPYGANGLANSLETATESGIINYTLAYSNATNSAVINCLITCPTVTNNSSDNSNPTTCNGVNGTIKLCGLASNVSNYIINYTFNGSAATPLINQTADVNGCLLINNLSVGVYSNIIITHPVYCTSGTTAVGPITLIAPIPSIPIASVTVQPTCEIVSATVVVSSPVQGTGFEYSIDGGTYQTSSTFIVTTEGSHSITVRRSSDITCVSPSTSVNVFGYLCAITETTSSINGFTGGTTSVLTNNDTLNGSPVTIGIGGNVTISVPNPLPTGLTLNTTTGVVTVAPNTPSGTYPVTYTICEVVNPSNCDTVTSNVVVFVTDFTPTIDIDNVVFLSAGVTKDFVINISDIDSGPSIGQVVFKIFKQSAFTITYNPATTISNVGGGTMVNNNDWIITEDPLFITVTLKLNVVINASSFSSVGFTITRNSSIPPQTWQPITATIVTGSGGDSLDENNTYNVLVKAQ